MGIRDDARVETTAAILRAAREQIATVGGVGLSMRAVAREIGMVSSAVYRYFPTREALLTAMIMESYGNLATHLTGPGLPGDAARRWVHLADRFRGWGRAVPHEFQLIYGTPIPGYAAPPETVPAAAAVLQPFLTCAGTSPGHGFTGPELQQQFSVFTGQGVAAPAAAAVVAELAALVGFITLELGGHFVGLADPTDHLYRAVVKRQLTSLQLDDQPTGA